jgi:chromate reductase, NAD(P)H dehydrogenase (quinone)
MKKIRLAVIVGSNRRDSINRRLAVALARLGADRFDAEFIQIDDLPMYNYDLEEDRPASVRRFTDQVAAAQTVLFVTPEFNRSIPAVLKNAIDWGSKPMENNVWKGKAVAITGTSPGAIGTAVGQQHLRQVLGILGSLVMGGEAYVSFPPGLIDEAGDVTVERTRGFLASFMEQFATLATHLELGREAAKAQAVSAA